MPNAENKPYAALAELFEAAKNGGDLKLADSVLKKLLALKPNHADLLSEQVKISLSLKKWRQATKAFDLLLSVRPPAEIVYAEYKKANNGSDWSPFSEAGYRNRLYLLLILIASSLLGAVAFHSAVPSYGVAFAIIPCAVILSEIIYRIYLYSSFGIPGERYAYPNKSSEEGFFPAADKDEQEFDAVRGFNLRPSSTFVRVGLKDGRVVEAHTATADKNGNVGFTDENFSENTINVLVLGDSYTNFPGNGAMQEDLEGIEWPYFFRRALHRNGYANVKIMNYARSGHGVLQMADTGAQLAEQQNVDVVIFAFIIRDLMRDRYWHMSFDVGGRPRSCRTKSPDPATSLYEAADQDIIDSRITLEWAKARFVNQDTDELTRELTDRYRELRRRTSARAIDLASWRHLYFCDLLFFGTPYIDLRITPRVAWLKAQDLFDYSGDQQFVNAINAIKKSGAKILLTVLPVKEDLLAGSPTFSYDNEPRLLKSLQRIVGEPVHFMQNFMNVEKDMVEARYARYPHDLHPSAWAMKLFGDAMARAVVSGKLGDSFKVKRSRPSAK